jgi:hypothetical protein
MENKGMISSDEAYLGSLPNLSLRRVFGCLTEVFIPLSSERTNSTPVLTRASISTLLKDSKGWLFYHSESGKLVRGAREQSTSFEDHFRDQCMPKDVWELDEMLGKMEQNDKDERCRTK